MARLEEVCPVLAWRALGAYDTEYGLREFSHVDPAGNLLRVGSRTAG